MTFCKNRFLTLTRGAGADLRLAHFEILGSTNDECARLAHDGEPGGLVVIADAQTAGRGRFDRTWASPPGGNLYMSMLVRHMPSAFSPQPSALSLAPPDWCALGLVASLSVLDAVERVLSERLQPSAFSLQPVLKWPNDLMVGTRKLCGILSAAGTDASGEPYAVVGIGVNVNSAPPGMNGPAATLIELAGKEIDLSEFAAWVAAGFLRRRREVFAGGFGAQFREWERRSGWVGREVTVSVGGPGQAPKPVSGRAMGLGNHGALRLQLEDGTVEEVSAGDATLRARDERGRMKAEGGQEGRGL